MSILNQNLKKIFFAGTIAVLTLVVGTALAAWTGPTSSSDGRAPFVNRGPETQVKTGRLNITSGAIAGSSVATFEVEGPALLAGGINSEGFGGTAAVVLGDVFVGYQGSPATPPAVGTDTSSYELFGNTTVSGNIQAQNLAHSDTDLHTTCTTTDGWLIDCHTTTPPINNPLPTSIGSDCSWEAVGGNKWQVICFGVNDTDGDIITHLDVESAYNSSLWTTDYVDADLGVNAPTENNPRYFDYNNTLPQVAIPGVGTYSAIKVHGGTGGSNVNSYSTFDTAFRIRATDGAGNKGPWKYVWNGFNLHNIGGAYDDYAGNIHITGSDNARIAGAADVELDLYWAECISDPNNAAGCYVPQYQIGGGSPIMGPTSDIRIVGRAVDNWDGTDLVFPYPSGYTSNSGEYLLIFTINKSLANGTVVTPTDHTDLQFDQNTLPSPDSILSFFSLNINQ